MRSEDKVIKSVGELISEIRRQHVANETVWYRGQGKREWPLKPSLLRKDNGPGSEMALFKRFRQNAVHFAMPGSKTEWEWMFLMQHYGVPTRLLDWTESPLIGLYFAVADASTKDEDSALWCMGPAALNSMANIQPELELNLPLFDVDDVLTNYTPSKIASETMSRLLPAAAIASRNSPRLFAQRGVFTISHRDETSIEDLGEKNHVWRYIIEPSSKEEIREELQLLKIDKLSLFPELPNVADTTIEGLL